jgi:hypothetical protein
MLTSLGKLDVDRLLSLADGYREEVEGHTAQGKTGLSDFTAQRSRRHYLEA